MLHLEVGSPISHWYVPQASLWPSPVSPTQPPKGTLGFQMCATTSSFYMGLVDPNSSTHPWVQSTYPSTQPRHLLSNSAFYKNPIWELGISDEDQGDASYGKMPDVSGVTSSGPHRKIQMWWYTSVTSVLGRQDKGIPKLTNPPGSLANHELQVKWEMVSRKGKVEGDRKGAHC